MKHIFIFLTSLNLLTINQVIFAQLPGLPDLKFGKAGKVAYDIGTPAGTRDVPETCFPAPDGKILVGGYSDNGNNSDFSIIRINSDGLPDPEFGTDGKVLIPVGPAADFGTALIIDANQKIVFAGYSFTQGISGHDYAIVRLNSDGSLDSTFSGDGITVIPVGEYDDQATSVDIQEDGRIVVAGFSNNEPFEFSDTLVDFSAIRLNPDGSLDTSFGVYGKIIIPAGRQADRVADIAIQPDGKILLAGEAYNGTDSEFAVIRLNYNGSLDNTFDNDGKVLADIVTGPDHLSSMSLQNDGKILLAGSGESDYLVVRLITDGSFDSSFANDGKLTIDVGSMFDYANDITTDSSGKILAAGYSSTGPGRYGFSNDFSVVRLHPDGTPDSTFSEDGKLIIPIGPINGSIDEGKCITTDKTGSIYIAGSTALNLENVDFAVVKLNVNGIVDSTFSADGIQSFQVGNANDIATASAVLPEGKIIVGGYSQGIDGDDFSVLKLMPDGSPDSSFGNSGKLYYDLGSFADHAEALAVQQDGKILLAGSVRDSLNTDFAVVRLNPDGTPDSDFGMKGKLIISLSEYDDEAKDMIILSDGDILIGGRVQTSFSIYDQDFAVIRFNPDGAIDSTFGINGISVTDLDSTSDFLTFIQIQTDGKIIAGGFSQYTSSGLIDFSLVRLKSDGTPDNTFSQNGRLLISPGGLLNQAYAGEIQKDGKILIAGRSADFQDNRLISLVRLNNNGDPDNDFGNEGIVTINSGIGADITQVLIQTDEKIILSGSVFDHGDQFLAIRLLKNGTPDETFGTEGQRKYQYGISTSAAFSADNQLLLAGSTDGDFSVMKITTESIITESENDKYLSDRKTLIFPNPTSGKFSILSHTDFPLSVSIYNSSGLRIKTFSSFPGNSEVDLGDQPSGIYLIRFEGRSESLKVVLE
jgi:uncharacterized delta-60 repeat protein